MNLDMELYRRYLNTGLNCLNLINKRLNSSNFIYCGAHYSTTNGDEVSIESELLSIVMSAQSTVMKSMYNYIVTRN